MTSKFFMYQKQKLAVKKFFTPLEIYHLMNVVLMLGNPCVQFNRPRFYHYIISREIPVSKHTIIWNCR